MVMEGHGHVSAKVDEGEYPSYAYACQVTDE